MVTKKSFMIDLDLVERLKAMKARAGLSEAEQIRRGIRMWLESREWPVRPVRPVRPPRQAYRTGAPPERRRSTDPRP